MADTRAQLLSKKRYNRQKIDEQQKLVNNLDNEIARLENASQSLKNLRRNEIEPYYNVKSQPFPPKCNIKKSFDDLEWRGKSREDFDVIIDEAVNQAKGFAKAVGEAADLINNEIETRKNKRDEYNGNINIFTKTLNRIERDLHNLTN